MGEPVANSQSELSSQITSYIRPVLMTFMFLVRIFPHNHACSWGFALGHHNSNSSQVLK